MKPNTKIAFAALLSAAGAVLTAFAAEFNGGPTEAPTDPAAPAEPPKEKKSRKNSATTAPAETAPETAAEPEPEEKKQAETKPAGGVANPKYDEHRKMIEPLVTGEESTAELRQKVKDLVKKYDTDNDPPSIKTMPVRNHADFERDLAALSY